MTTSWRALLAGNSFLVRRRLEGVVAQTAWKGPPLLANMAWRRLVNIISAKGLRDQWVEIPVVENSWFSELCPR